MFHQIHLTKFHSFLFSFFSLFRFQSSCSPKAKTSALIRNYIFSKLERNSNSNVSFWSIAIDPVEECVNSITFVVWIFDWFHIHIHSGCKIMNFWDPINMVLRRITSHLHIIIKVGVHYSHPDHCIFDSFKVREVSNINVHDCWRLIEGNFIGSSFKFMLIVK